MRSAIAAGLATFLLTLPAAAQPLLPERIPSLTVRGDGQADVAPDHARLTVEVSSTARSLEQATAQHRERADRALTALRGMAGNGIAIERSTFRLDQVRQPRVPEQAPRPGDIEYRAVTTFELKSKKLESIDAAVTAIAATGLFEVRNIRFGLDEKSKGLNEARRNAVQDARERAQIYAQAAGVQLGDIVEITDTEPRMLRPVAVEPMMARSNVPVIPPETLTLNAGVTITWRIKGGN
ncbi:MAG: SIMPL domain-containing protein [Pseudorhodoplanes sp.]